MNWRWSAGIMRNEIVDRDKMGNHDEGAGFAYPS